MSTLLRLFIALELPPHVLEALEATQRDLRPRVPERAARWVRPEGIHLTLKFLGDVPAGQVDAVGAAMREAARDHAPFELRAEGLGVFPNPQKARVLWVGVKGELETLGRLQASVEEHVAPLGYPTESRSFSAHLTLARASRNASRAEQEALGGLVGSSDVGTLVAWQVGAVNLMRSQLKPGGAVYTRLAEAVLTGES
jgi:2'-5' RNA ligase